MQLKKLSIIIVTRNSEKYIEKCLDSLYKSIIDIDYEIIVVDNNSNDLTVDIIKSKYKDIKIIKNCENKGFGYGNNLGYRHSNGKYILFLNPDVILYQDSIKNAIKRMEENPRIGLLGGKVFTPLGKLQVPCTMKLRDLWDEFCVQFYLYRLFPKSRLFGRFIRTYDTHENFMYVDIIAGCFMFFRREAFESINGFDENIFLYGEEEDIGYRLKRYNWKVAFDPNVKLIHFGGQSLGFRDSSIWIIISNDYIAKKYEPLLIYIIIRILRVIGYFLRFIFLFILDKFKWTKRVSFYFFGFKFNINPYRYEYILKNYYEKD